MQNPELRDLVCRWEDPTQDGQHLLLFIEQTHGDDTKTKLWLTRLQAEHVARKITAKLQIERSCFPLEFDNSEGHDLEFKPVGQ